MFAGGDSVTGGSADPRNNVENVFLPAGISGPFTVDVTGTNIAGDGVPGNADTTDQDYALVVSDAAPASGAAVLTGDEPNTTEIGDGDGRLEPGERFDLTERLHNRGDHLVSGVSAVLSPAAPRITVPNDTSAYVNIPIDAVRNNTTPFRVKLASDFTCGEPRRADARRDHRARPSVG